MFYFSVLHKETFYIIHINIFCYCSSQDRYYPAEIAIAGFSLDDGVKEECVYHRIIKPGKLLKYICSLHLLFYLFHCPFVIPIASHPFLSSYLFLSPLFVFQFHICFSLPVSLPPHFRILL